MAVRIFNADKDPKRDTTPCANTVHPLLLPATSVIAATAAKKSFGYSYLNQQARSPILQWDKSRPQLNL